MGSFNQYLSHTRQLDISDRHVYTNWVRTPLYGRKQACFSSEGDELFKIKIVEQKAISHLFDSISNLFSDLYEKTHLDLFNKISKFSCDCAEKSATTEETSLEVFDTTEIIQEVKRTISSLSQLLKAKKDFEKKVILDSFVGKVNELSSRIFSLNKTSESPSKENPQQDFDNSQENLGNYLGERSKEEDKQAPVSADESDEIVQKETETSNNNPPVDVQVSSLVEKGPSSSEIIVSIIPELYSDLAQTSNLDSAKALGFNDPKLVYTSNIDQLTVVKPRELSHGTKSEFEPDCSIKSALTQPKIDLNPMSSPVNEIISVLNSPKQKPLYENSPKKWSVLSLKSCMMVAAVVVSGIALIAFKKWYGNDTLLGNSDLNKAINQEGDRPLPDKLSELTNNPLQLQDAKKLPQNDINLATPTQTHFIPKKPLNEMSVISKNGSDNSTDTLHRLMQMEYPQCKPFEDSFAANNPMFLNVNKQNQLNSLKAIPLNFDFKILDPVVDSNSMMNSKFDEARDDRFLLIDETIANAAQNPFPSLDNVLNEFPPPDLCQENPNNVNSKVFRNYSNQIFPNSGTNLRYSFKTDNRLSGSKSKKNRLHEFWNEFDNFRKTALFSCLVGLVKGRREIYNFYQWCRTQVSPPQDPETNTASDTVLPSVSVLPSLSIETGDEAISGESRYREDRTRLKNFRPSRIARERNRIRDESLAASTDPTTQTPMVGSTSGATSTDEHAVLLTILQKLDNLEKKEESRDSEQSSKVGQQSSSDRKLKSNNLPKDVETPSNPVESGGTSVSTDSTLPSTADLTAPSSGDSVFTFMSTALDSSYIPIPPPPSLPPPPELDLPQEKENNIEEKKKDAPPPILLQSETGFKCYQKEDEEEEGPDEDGSFQEEPFLLASAASSGEDTTISTSIAPSSIANLPMVTDLFSSISSRITGSFTSFFRTSAN